MKRDFSSKLIASVSAPIADITFCNEFLAVASTRGVSIWTKTDTTKPRSVLSQGADIILPIGSNLSFCTISGNQLSFLKFELGTKTVLDSRGIGKGRCVHSHSIQNCHQVRFTVINKTHTELGYKATHSVIFVKIFAKILIEKRGCANVLPIRTHTPKFW